MHTPTFGDLLTHLEYQELKVNKLGPHLFPGKYTGDTWGDVIQQFGKQMIAKTGPIQTALHYASEGVQRVLDQRMLSAITHGKSADEVALLTKMGPDEVARLRDLNLEISMPNTLGELELSLFLLGEEGKKRLKKSKTPGPQFLLPVTEAMNIKYKV